MTVSAEGSKRAVERCVPMVLDQVEFVAWSYHNGLGGKDAGIGNHTHNTVECKRDGGQPECQRPGDLVFYHPASAGDDNYVGIVVGVNDNGSLLIVHCSSSQKWSYDRRSMVSRIPVCEKSAGAGMIK